MGNMILRFRQCGPDAATLSAECGFTVTRAGLAVQTEIAYSISDRASPEQIQTLKDVLQWPRGYEFVTASQQTVDALNDQSGGAANNTLQEVPDPPDLPLTADALRDSLVVTVLPAIRNNEADLAAKLNEVIAALVSAGILSG